LSLLFDSGKEDFLKRSRKKQAKRERFLKRMKVEENGNMESVTLRK